MLFLMNLNIFLRDFTHAVIKFSACMNRHSISLLNAKLMLVYVADDLASVCNKWFVSYSLKS